ncbi:hypothetical protein [Micromonospora sp. KC213]|uniref:hypothetical protein n=1 Tax=Micromonospora sp. KC213 TaxID=2530378 RepID=UPI00104AE63A|nr:hypothetical protein [Micromonospora sp. KC213]TDC28963.1 hypothetical protein E1166_30275 [Micromonospora sp. KC213]
MANKMLGKVVAGAALGGASLLVLTPGIALADGTHHGGDREGNVFAKPHVAKPGETVRLIEVCPQPQEHAYVWSKVTGKVKLKPASEAGGDRRDWKGGDEGAEEQDRGGRHGRGEEGRGKHGRDEHGRDEQGRDEHGRDEHGRDEHEDDRRPSPQPSVDGGQPGGTGGGLAADGGSGYDRKAYEEEQTAEERGGRHEWERKGHDWQAEEHDQAAESERGEDTTGREHGERGGKGEHADAGTDTERGWQGGHRDTDTDAEHDWRGEDAATEDAATEERGWKHKKDFVYYGEARVSPDAAPGRYELKGSCGEGELVVLPRGHVDGGDGGLTTGADGGMAVGGAGMIGAAALGGIVLMRRRQADGLV